MYILLGAKKNIYEVYHFNHFGAHRSVMWSMFTLLCNRPLQRFYLVKLKLYTYSIPIPPPSPQPWQLPFFLWFWLESLIFASTPDPKAGPSPCLTVALIGYLSCDFPPSCFSFILKTIINENVTSIQARPPRRQCFVVNAGYNPTTLYV